MPAAKVALVHEWLTGGPDGASRILRVLADVFPDAPIHVFAVDSASSSWIDPGRLRPSIIQGLTERLGYRRQLLLPLMPTAVRSMNLSGYDLVISISTAFAKNVTVPGAPHLCYCCSPMRFAWDWYPRYLDERGLRGPLRWLTAWQLARLRRWDLRGSREVDRFVAISHHVRQRIQRYYDRDADVLYPPVEVDRLSQLAPPDPNLPYLCLSRLSPYKRVDLAIKACCQSGRRLLVGGSGGDLGRLRRIACPDVEFLGFVPDQDLAATYARAKALIFAGEEDFGLVMVEAMAAGRPVVALGRGGATETVISGVTGELFEEESAAALVGALDRLEEGFFDVAALRTQASRFSTAAFVAGLSQILGELSP